ncbi:MAG: hypothetical protein SGI92_27085 [Bryobacteraceae bacterium]|nr:hypothetical protein [Bryobacteraceae bacterium]
MLPAVLLAAATVALWQEPSVSPDAVPFEVAARGAPVPRQPFQFVKEELSGTSAKVMVRDAAGLLWQVKGGLEGRADAFATRLASAVGYYADAVWFLREGRIEGVRGSLGRAAGFVRPDGTFTYAAFELRDSTARYVGDDVWTWTRNPFVGSAELRGLKLLVMLVSNWDNKDARDVRSGSNAGVVEVTGASGEVRRTYFVNDWGQSFGSWGNILWLGRSNWNCGAYRSQTPEFVRVGPDSKLIFGYRGQHTADFSNDITQADARWLLRLLRRIRPEQIRAGLTASGASAAEASCFAPALIERIEVLRRAAEGGRRELP